MTNAWGYGDEESDAEGDTVAVTLTPFQSELLARIDRIADALEPRAGKSIGDGHFAPLLDASPEALGSAIEAGAVALEISLPLVLRGTSRNEVKKIAERVIEAALLQVTTPADDADPVTAPTGP